MYSYLDLKEYDTTMNGTLLSIAFVCIVNYTLLIIFLLVRYRVGHIG